MNLGFLPTKLKEFAKNVTELKFDEEPNYDKWIREFQSNHNDSPYVTSNPCKKVSSCFLSKHNNYLYMICFVDF